MSPGPPPKVFLKHEWQRELGSEDAQRPEVVLQFRNFQSDQPILSPSPVRAGRPVVCRDESGHEQPMLNEVNTNFLIPGKPQSFVNHAQSTSVRELIQKIENHPDRHALQQDLRQNQAYNPFSPESKKNDSGSGQHQIV